MKREKIYKSNDMILIDDKYTIEYDIFSKRNIFIRHYVEMNCSFCEKEICQYIGMDLDTDPEDIKFFPLELKNHLKKKHSDEFVCIKKLSINKKKQKCKLILKKKIIL